MEATLQMIHRHVDAPDVCNNSLEVIVALVSSDDVDAGRRKFRATSAGAFDAIAQAMKTCSEDSAVQSTGCQAFTLLCEGHAKNPAPGMTRAEE